MALGNKIRLLALLGSLVILLRLWMQAAKVPPTAIVVGSGLAGLTTSLELLKNGVRVVLIEKTDKLGGNSIKASSGINGVPTRFQPPGDSVGSFYEDTIISGKGLARKDLVWELTNRSEEAISWLLSHGIDLSKVSQLGGHSFARTHRGSGGLPPGFAIISALSKKLQEYPSDQLIINKNSQVQRLLTKAGKVTGVEFTQEGEKRQLVANNVILATGGYSADSELIAQYRPDLLNYPSTNGVQTTGDGQKLAARDVDAKLLHMDQVQVHPTGFVRTSEKDSRWKFLCGELLRGIGGILISPDTGDRFVNELSTRDVVTGALLKHCKKKTAVILINENDYEQAKSHIDFYVKQELLTKGNVQELVDLVNIEGYGSLIASQITHTLSAYHKSIKHKKDIHGRTHFGSRDNSGIYYFGFVTPVLHFSMGGVAINQKGQVLTKEDKVVPNLFAAGEVSGGVHGGNRLGGSSLLECVVFGKIVSEEIVQQE